jgi:RNA polymerase sigma-70 factor (ECF subfamily)
MTDDARRRAQFEALFAAHHDAVRRYVVRRARETAIDDAVAETFLVAWRRFDDLPESALPWLLGVARRVLADQGRAARRRQSLSQRLRIEPTEAPEWLPPSLSDGLAEALASLSEHEREALLLVAWDGLAPREAAIAAGCSATMFRVRLHRARRQVAAHLSIDDRLTRPEATEKLS